MELRSLGEPKRGRQTSDASFAVPALLRRSVPSPPGPLRRHRGTPTAPPDNTVCHAPPPQTRVASPKRLWPCMISASGKRRFIPHRPEQNVYGSFYHVRVRLL